MNLVNETESFKLCKQFGTTGDVFFTSSVGRDLAFVDKGLKANVSDARYSVPINKKEFLTLREAAAYTGIGINKLREISNDENCGFVLWVGNKRLLKRRKMEEYLAEAYSV